MIPYGHQSINDDDIAAVTQILKGDWLTQGPAVEEFEEALCSYTDAKFAVVFSSGTAALHAACAVAGFGPGNSIYTSALTFSASAACALYVGAEPRFLDISPDTLNMDLSLLPPNADGLIAVHYAGLPIDFAKMPYRPGIIIEDASHALGAIGKNGPIGNCADSDMCTFSFHPVKAITTGEGGAVTTNSKALANSLRTFRSHGIVHKQEQGNWFYEVDSIGFNYRLTDIQSALGLSQLKRLDRFIERRNEIASRYRELLQDLQVTCPPSAPVGSTHAYHLFPVRVKNRRAIFDYLRNAGIGAQVHYIPLYKHPLYARTGSQFQFPSTETVYGELLSLPIFPDLTDADQDIVIEVLGKALNEVPDK